MMAIVWPLPSPTILPNITWSRPKACRICEGVMALPGGEVAAGLKPRRCKSRPHSRRAAFSDSINFRQNPDFHAAEQDLICPDLVPGVASRTTCPLGRLLCIELRQDGKLGAHFSLGAIVEIPEVAP